MRRLIFIAPVLIICLALTVSGCSSAQKKLSEEVKGVRTQVDTLETRVEGVESKQAETERMAMEQAQRLDEMRAAKMRSAPAATNIQVKRKKSSKDKQAVREIQTCLKNAGFYDGKIDGIKGRRTRAAIRKFQKANGLVADGVVGKRTWEALDKYAAGASYGSMQEEAK